MPAFGALLSIALAAATPAASDALTLEDAVARALARDERAAIATEQEAASQARLWKARAFFFPELVARADYTHRPEETTRDFDGPGPSPPVVVQAQDAVGTSLVASTTIFDARAFPLWRAARKSRDATRFSSADSRRAIAFEAAEAYLAVLGVQQIREAAEKRLALANDALVEAKARFDAKLVGVNDVTRAELEVAVAQREAARARSETDLARLELGFLLGTEVPPALAPPSALLEKAQASPADTATLTDKVGERPDVLAAKRRAEAAKAVSGEPLARTLPTVSASATYRGSNEAGITGREKDWWVGGTATWTLFDGGERYADRREKKAEARIASLEASALERRARIELEQARISVLSAQAAYAAARAEVEAARKNERETSALYAQGLASSLEASTARVSLFEAEVALVREQYGLASAYLAIPDALGQDPFGRSVTAEAGK